MPEIIGDVVQLQQALSGLCWPALVIAFGGFAWLVSRAVLLHRAGSAALNRGSDDERRKAGLKIIKALTSDNGSWYRAILPWLRSGDGQQ